MSDTNHRIYVLAIEFSDTGLRLRVRAAENLKSQKQWHHTPVL